MTHSIYESVFTHSGPDTAAGAELKEVVGDQVGNFSDITAGDLCQ